SSTRSASATSGRSSAAKPSPPEATMHVTEGMVEAAAMAMVDAWCYAGRGSPAAERGARENLQEAWAALRMLREAIEPLGPVGALPAEEHLDGPAFTHEAEALVAGIRRMAASPAPAPAADAGSEVRLWHLIYLRKN